MKNTISPIVTVIVPVFNTEKYIEECLLSIQNQTYNNLEIIIVNDGSTDKSLEIIENITYKDKRCKFFNQSNQGGSVAKNKALDMMNGEYCIFVDSDDFISENLIRDTMQIAMENDSDCVIYNYKTFHDKKEITLEEDSNDVFFLTNKEAMEIILRGYPFRMLACNKLYKASLWENIRFPEDRTYGDDSYVTYKLLHQANGIIYTSKYYYFYRQRNNSLLHRNVTLKNLEIFKSYDELILFIRNNYSDLEELAVNSYKDRIFDFMYLLTKSNIAIHDKKEMLIELKKYVRNNFLRLIKNKYCTMMQKILLSLLILLPSYLFIFIYKLVCFDRNLK